MEKKWSWSRFVIVFTICIVAGVIGRCTADSNFSRESGKNSSEMKESMEDMDFVPENLVYVYGKFVATDSLPDNIECIDGKLVNKDTKKVYSSTEEVYSDNPIEGEMEKETPSARVVNKITITKQYSVQAEVFRLVDGYYKDANRKETISIVVLSNGITMMKKHFDGYGYARTFLGEERISKLPGYEYQCFSTDGKDDKVYAYNENDKKIVK